MVAMAKKGDAGTRPEGDAAMLKDVDYKVTKAVLDSISITTETILLAEYGRFMKNNDFMLATKDSFMSYVSALAVLSLALKEESKENMSKLMGTIGIDFDEKIFDMVPKNYVHNHLVYVYAFYFLVINGKETNETNLRKVVEALGINFDRTVLEESLGYICANTRCGNILR
jgi:ribosomal protein L12E/L44/L45/RPP1/RPP2